MNWLLFLDSSRRATNGRFVPPIKKDQDDGSSFGDEVRSRVLYGGRGPSSKGTSDSQLPPELEGDERLKNIEPRMVELIVNEVRAHVYHTYGTHHVARTCI